MKVVILLMFFVNLCSSQCRYKESSIKNENKFSFGEYIVVTGSCDKGSIISISRRGKNVFRSCRGDGKYAAIDTMDINQDKKMDFVFSYAFDDYSSLGIIVSTRGRGRYEIISIEDDLYSDQDCSVEPYQVNDVRIKDFILTDFDKDGKKDILTIGVQNPDYGVQETECSRIILHQQLLQKLKAR